MNPIGLGNRGNKRNHNGQCGKHAHNAPDRQKEEVEHDKKKEGARNMGL